MKRVKCFSLIGEELMASVWSTGSCRVICMVDVVRMMQ